MEEKLVRVSPSHLHTLIKNKLTQAGLLEEHADEVANHLVFADLCGIHSHGAVRVDYYAERIAKGGITINPNYFFEKTGPSSGIFHGDNGMGHYLVNKSLDHVQDLISDSGIAILGIEKMSHSGTMAYFVRKLAQNNLVAISMCQSDPMVVPFGGAEVYFGTNPIGFAAPRLSPEPIVFDMATTVQAWGKILDARSKNKEIPNTWAVDDKGNPTTDPHKVSGLLPIAGPKGYGLMMMVDILSGSLLGLPFGMHVSSMYDKINQGRDLGQIIIAIDPKRFTDLEAFKARTEQMVNELHGIKPAEGFAKVYYPGELSLVTKEQYQAEGIPIPETIVDYLTSGQIHFDQYGGKGAFA